MLECSDSQVHDANGLRMQLNDYSTNEVKIRRYEKLGSFCKTTVAFLIFLRRQLINKHHDNNTHLRTRAKKETSKRKDLITCSSKEGSWMEWAILWALWNASKALQNPASSKWTLPTVKWTNPAVAHWSHSLYKLRECKIIELAQYIHKHVNSKIIG